MTVAMRGISALTKGGNNDVSPKRTQIGAIGVEFANENLHLVQMEKGVDGAIKIRAKTSIPYPLSRQELLASPAALKTLLRNSLKQVPFSGRRVISALPSGDVKIMSIAYQLTKGQSDGEAILEMLANRIDGDLADKVIDYIPVRTKGADKEHLAVVAIADRETVIAYLETLRLAGLNVEALEIGPAAIRRLISTILNPGFSENVMVINFGSTKSYLTLISGRRLFFDHEVDFGEQILLEKIMSTLDADSILVRELVSKYGFSSERETMNSCFPVSDIDVSEALMEIAKPMFLKLVEEINRALIYAASETRGESIKQVYLLGSIARWPGVDVLLNKLVNIPVSLPNYMAAFGESSEVDGNDTRVPEMAVATGLALREIISNG